MGECRPWSTGSLSSRTCILLCSEKVKKQQEEEQSSRHTNRRTKPVVNHQQNCVPDKSANIKIHSQIFTSIAQKGECSEVQVYHAGKNVLPIETALSGESGNTERPGSQEAPPCQPLNSRSPTSGASPISSTLSSRSRDMFAFIQFHFLGKIRK